MALPVSISVATYPQKNSYLGPFLSSAENVYFVAFDTTSSDPAVYKATDPTSSFSEQDSTNRPILSGHTGTLTNYTLTVIQDGAILRIVTSDASSGNPYNYHDFNTGTDLWATKNVVVLSSTTLIAVHRSFSLVRRSDASLILLLNDVREFLMGTNFARVSYAKSTDSGANWTTPTAVGATGVKRHIFGSRAVLGASDRIHFFYSDDVTAKHRSLSSADVLGTEETPTSANAVTASEHNFIPGVSYVSGANTVIKTAYRASGSDKLDSIEFNSAATGAALGTANFTDNTIFDNGTTIPASVHGCMALDNTTAYCVYSGQTNQHIFRDSETDGGAWGTDIDAFTGTINAVSANIYTRSGSLVLAYVMDDGGTVKYNEILLSLRPRPRTRAERAVSPLVLTVGGVSAPSALTRTARTRYVRAS